MSSLELSESHTGCSLPTPVLDKQKSILNIQTFNFNRLKIANYFLFIAVFFFLFAVLHTSASLALNESWDPDVRYIPIIVFYALFEY